MTLAPAIALVLVLVLVLALALAGAARAQGGCGGVETAQPRHHPRGQRPPLVLGDSTMLLALYGLAAKGYEANAHGCREYPEALALLRARKREGTLPHMVVIALGANGSVTHDDIGETLGLLCCRRLLVLVTPRELGGGSGSDAATIREEARRHRNRTLLLDWVRYSAGHGNWFQPDGLHLTTPGAQAFTRLLARALPDAYPKRTRRRHPRARRLSAAPAIPAALALRTSLARAGYVGVTVTGPVGARVAVGEQLPARTLALAVVGLNDGVAHLPRALTWRCDRRRRRLVASALAPAAVQQAVAGVLTPSCSRRLGATIGRRAGVGRGLAIHLRDRWGIGGLAPVICLAPPGGGSSCHPWALGPDQPRRVVRLADPRPGGWRVSVRTPYGQQVARSVWASHPGGRIHLLAAGDSEMQLVDDFLGQDLRSRGVQVTSDARISTGLTNSFFFDWQRHARAQAATLRPDVTVMFMGGNEGFPIRGQPGRQVFCCNPGWSAGYAGLVARMMSTYLRGAAGRVYWFLLPTPRAANMQRLFDAVNAGIRSAATRFPGRVSLIDANRFFTPGNRYRDFMSYHGHGFVVHEADGAHLSDAADVVAAELVVRQLVADDVVR